MNYEQTFVRVQIANEQCSWHRKPSHVGMDAASFIYTSLDANWFYDACLNKQKLPTKMQLIS